MPFLDIPTEIRQQVLDLVICSRVTPPDSPSASQHDRKRLGDGPRRADSIWQRPPKNPALPVMLVNKQIYEDVQQVLRHAGTDYHVDIMFVKDRGMWTTWSIPALPRTQYIDSVHATFRIFEPTEDLDERFKNCLPFRGCDGGPPGAVWAFYTLLSELLRSGPGYLKPPQNERRPSCPYAVKKIVVDILSPTDGVLHRSMVTSNAEFDDRRWYLTTFNHVLADVEKAPEMRLVEYMVWAFEWGWSLDYYTIDYGAIFVEGVRDTIDFMVNGELHRQFNVAEYVKTMKKPWFGMTPKSTLRRKRMYRKWRKWLEERRRLMDQGVEFDTERPVERIIIY